MSRGAHLMAELRIPVRRPLGSVFASDEIPMHAEIEYLVLEYWNDDTVRHPTTGVVVAGDLFRADRDGSIRFLRTEGR